MDSSVARQALFLSACVFAAFAAAHSLTWKMGYDQAIFTVIGQTMLDGGVPYRDAWDVKGPLTFYAYALSLWLWNRPGLSIRIFDVFALIACSLALRRLVGVLVNDKKIANFSAIVFSLIYFTLGYWNTAQPDGWAGFVLVGVILLLIDPVRRPQVSMAIAGAWIAAATLLKPTFAPYVALLIAFPCARVGDRGYPLGAVAMGIASFCSVIAISLTLLAISCGGWEDILDVARFYMAHATDRPGPRMLRMQFLCAYSMPLVLAASGIVLLYHSGERRRAGLMAWWCGIGLAVTALQGKYWPYHFIPLLTALVPPMAVSLSALSSLRRRWALSAILTLMLVPLAVTALYDNDESMTYEKPQAAIAAYVVANSDADEKVLVMSRDVSVYALAERRPPTRFSFDAPLIVESLVRDRYRQKFMREINDDSPHYILFDTHSGPETLRLFPEFNAFLRARYTLATQVGVTEIWQLTPSCCVASSSATSVH